MAENPQLKEQALHMVRDESAIPRGSVENENTAAVAAAGTCGARTAGRGYVDMIREVDGEPKRITTWLLDGGPKLAFYPAFKAEEITVGEFFKRFHDAEWVKANPDHPIAYLHHFHRNLRKLTASVKNRKPGKMITRGRKFLMLEDGVPADVAAKFLEDFEKP